MDEFHVWAKGDRCLAPYSEDGETEEYYEAKIEKIMRLPGSSKMVASVKFLGYEEDGMETFHIEKLKKIKSKVTDEGAAPRPCQDEDETDSMSGFNLTLVSQEEERKRIQNLYDSFEEDIPKSSQKSPWATKSRYLLDAPKRSPAKKQKAAIAKGGVKSSRTVKASLAAEKNNLVPEVKPSSDNWDRSPIENTSDNEAEKTAASPKVSPVKSQFSGFSDEDLERPRFTDVPCGDKVPLFLSPEGVSPVIQVPATINQYLRDYQREGIKFLYSNFVKGRGAILADDMGLGKTVQVIGFIAAILGKTGTKTDVMRLVPKFIRQLSNSDDEGEEDEGKKKVFLVIGPASVLYNWVDEFETWGHFRVGKFHQGHKEETLADLDKGKLDVVITTFETCRDHLDDINRFDWTAVFADEAHKIKGKNAEITKALKKLRCKRRYGLSGTVVQNDMKELWCVLDWAIPKCLGSLAQFEIKFEKVIAKGQKRDASKRELAEARKAKDEFSKLRSQWMIRRTKSLIAHQLPKKDQKVVYCQPTSFQVSVYKAILGHKMMKFVLTQNHPCPCDSGRTRGKCCFHTVKDADGNEYKVSGVTMTFMHLLMKVSNHVALLLPNHTDSPEQQKRAAEICNVAFSSHPHFLQQTRTASFRTLSDPQYCGKMKVLCGLLSVFKKESSKVLIFSLSTRLLDILEQYIISKGYEYRRLDGKTPNIRRTQLVREFNKEPSIFLFIASTKAGGIGLNLTGANVVVIFDPNWNPSHDLQAEDRAYRIGQGKDVRVFRLICSGTIEEIVYLRQVYKQQLDKVAVSDQNARRLFHGVHGDKSNTGELFGISNLFSLREGDSTLTADILQRNLQAEAGIRGYKVSEYVAPVSEKQDDDHDSDEDASMTEAEETDRDIYGADYLFTQMFDDKVSTEDEEVSPSKKPRLRSARHASSHDESEGDSEHVHGSPEPSTSTGIKRCPPKKRTRQQLAAMESSESDDVLPKQTKKKKPKKNEYVQPANANLSYESLGDVFRDCGVVHTHDNRRVVGPSKAEDYMTRCALQEVYELHQNSQEPALQCMPLSSSEESDDLGPIIEPVDKLTKSQPAMKQKARKEAAEIKQKRPKTVAVNGKKVLIGQTPKAIRKTHLQDMMAYFGEDNAVKFAELLLSYTRQKREEMLRDFYTSQDKALEAAFISSESSDEDKKEKTTRRPRKTNGGTSKTRLASEKPATSSASAQLDSKRKKILKEKPVNSPLPTKRVTLAKGCQFSSLSTEDEEEEQNKIQENLRQNRVSQKASKSKRDAKVGALVFEREFDKVFGLDEGSTYGTQDSHNTNNTESLIDDILGICKSPVKRAPQAKSKTAKQKNEIHNNKDINIINEMDSVAVIDNLFSERASKVRAPPKRKTGAIATTNSTEINKSTADILDFFG